MFGGHSASRKSVVVLNEEETVVCAIVRRTGRTGDIQRRQEGVHGRAPREEDCEDLCDKARGLQGRGSFVFIQ